MASRQSSVMGLIALMMLMVIEASVSGNGRKKLLVIGKTGTGKSILCNVLTGNPSDHETFPVSSEPVTCTQEIKLVNADFCGDPNRPFSIIDTIGFDDPTKNHDAIIINELVLKLQKDCDYINTIVMTVNGHNPRLDGSLLDMIKIFEKMFTDRFWDQVVVVFTRLQMDQAAKERRFEGGDSDDIFAKKYIAEVEKYFGVKGGRLKYLFIDSKYRKDVPEEVAAFNEETETLFKHLMRMPNLPTSEVTKVRTENEKLSTEMEKLRSEATKVRTENEKLRTEKEKLRIENEKEKLRPEKEKLRNDNEKEKLRNEKEKLRTDNEKRDTLWKRVLGGAAGTVVGLSTFALTNPVVATVIVGAGAIIGGIASEAV